jgi:membrane-associated phospholipid phosphatase
VPFLVLFLVALIVGGFVAFVAWLYPTAPGAPSGPAMGVAERVGHRLGRHRRLLRLVERRLNSEVATGLALTIALGFVLVGGLTLGALAYLVRTSSQLVELDASVAQWGADHAGELSERALSLITHLGDTEVAIVLALVVAVIEYRRKPNRWIVPFLAVVIAGQNLLTNGIKELLDRVRPTLNPIAETLGPSFPSGHSATAAALYAACALLLGRGRGPVSRAFLAGAAAAVAVSVACTRVLLDVHWLSDVAAGLALGWAWFAVTAIAFGGRFLRFGAGIEVAERVADEEAATPSTSNPRRPRRATRTRV